MIPPRKGGPAGRAVAGYVRWKLRSAFRGVWVRGTPSASTGGLLVYANHPGFWDGFVAHELSRAAGWDAYCLMEERNLRRYPFLARLGAFSIEPGRAGSALESLRYARALLRRPRAVVFIFPEGELRPFGEMPLRLARGVEVLARISGAPCLPVGIRYVLLEHEKPDVLLDVGSPHPPAPLEALRERLEERVRRLAAVTRLEGFDRLLAGWPGVAERWDRVRGLGDGARP